MYFMGVDVGTQGARCVVADEDGTVAAAASCPIAAPPVRLPTGWAEQDPESWWEAACQSMREAVARLSDRGVHPREIRAVAVDSTSGTVLPIDASGTPLRRAIMYNDGRATLEADECNLAAPPGTPPFNASYALAKILWVRRHEPDLYRRAARFIHAADYLVGRLTGRWDVSDFSNALKTGCDPETCIWPAFITNKLGLPTEKLPTLVAPGEPIAAVGPEAAEATRIHRGTLVVAGMTDGTAGFVASGAAAPGEWNTTLGTTLVVRGVSPTPVRDPLGRIYNHRHPQGYWLPGGASNTGGEWMAVRFPSADYAAMDLAAASLMPTQLVVFPLARRGERLPFIHPNAQGFTLGEPTSDLELYAAALEGVALVEAWCYQLLESLGAPNPTAVFTTGGGARSAVWAQVRADVLQVPVRTPSVPDAAMGAAILAASRTRYSGLQEAMQRMVRTGRRTEPRRELAAEYQAKLALLREECAARGYAPTQCNAR